MKNIMLATALGAVAGTSALAEAHVMQMDTYEASDLMGMRVYAGESSGTVDDWNDIGEIDDILVTMNGDVPSIVVGVGGFLGMGEKDVALTLDRISLVTGDDGNQFLVVNATQEELEQMPEYESTQERAAEAMVDDAAADVDAATDEVAAEAEDAAENMEAEAEDAAADVEATAEEAAADVEAEAEEAEAEVATADTGAMTMPMVERDGFSNVDRAELTTENLTGARVYDVNDEDIGEINSLIVGDDGTLTDAIIDVGGFLGMGEKQVLMPMDAIQIMRGDGVMDLRIYVDQSKEQLEAMDEYEN